MTNNFKQETKTNLSCRSFVNSVCHSGLDPESRSLNRWMPEQVRHDTRKSFTLIELLVVLALVAILSVVVILTLNPAELLKQARDSNRLSDLATINTALNLFSTDVIGGFMGTSTVVYVSLPSTTSNCSSLGLPSLPTGYTYNCVTNQNLRNTDGTGWIPVNFNRISSNSPISQLPIDPTNTTSTRLYYTYTPGGSWELNATVEASKNKLGGSNDLTSKDGGTSPSQYEIGNNLNLTPIETGDPSLVGYWNFEEGSGAISADSSGLGYNGTWIGTSTNWYVSPGKVGLYAATFNNINDGLDITSTSYAGLQSYTMSAWVYPRGSHKHYTGSIISSGDWNTNAWVLGINQANTTLETRKADGSIGAISANYNFLLNTWTYVAVTRNGSSLRFYINGVSAGEYNSLGSGGLVSTAANTTIGRETYAGGYFSFNGAIDAVRVYNRALSAAEISALHNATK